MKTKALKTADECISEYIETLEKRIATARGYAAEQAIAREFVERFGDDEPDGDYHYPRLRVGFSIDPGTVNALMVNFDALTLAEVKPLLQWLAAKLGKYEIDDYPELGRRGYVFSKGRFRLQVFFNSSTDAQVCKFVQVGVKEEPVYKLMCGDEEPAVVSR